MYVGLLIKYPLFFSYFNETWIFSTDFRKILKYRILQKIRPAGTEMYDADGLTDMTKLIVDFRNFSKAPKKLFTLPQSVFMRLVWFIK